MLHPYNHELLHNYQQRERIKQVEDERLAQLVRNSARPTARLVTLRQRLAQLWGLRWQLNKDSRLTKGKVVMPKA